MSPLCIGGSLLRPGALCQLLGQSRVTRVWALEGPGDGGDTASLWSRCVLRHALHVENGVHGVAKSDMDIMDDISCCKFGFLRKDA